MKGQDIGYVRISSIAVERQLAGVPLDKLFEDVDSTRPARQACLDFVQPGDTLHVHSLDRIARNLGELRRLVDDLTGRGITLHFHKENLIFSRDQNPMVPLLSVLNAFAEFEKEVASERQKEGIAIAKTKGVYKGRAPSLTPEQVADAKARLAAGEKVAPVARSLGISRPTLYRYLQEPKAEPPAIPMPSGGKRRTFAPNE